MNNTTIKMVVLAIGLAGGPLLTGVQSAETMDGVVLIANQDVPTNHISAAALRDIYTGKTMYWPDGQRVIIVTWPGQTDSALKQISGMDASQFKTFWQRLVFSGRGQQPKKAEDAAGLVSLVVANRGALALAPADVALKGVKILEIK